MLKKSLFVLYCISVPIALLEVFCYFFRPAPLFEAINITSTSDLQYHLVENPELIYVPAKNTSAFNNAGHRGADFDPDLPQGKTRVAVVGDSVVEGFLLNAEERFTELLPSESNEFLNFGVRGYNLRQYIEYIKLRVLEYRPHTIIVGITYNDLKLDSGEIHAIKKTLAKLKHNSFYASYYGAKNVLTRALMHLNSFRYGLYYLSTPSGDISKAASKNFTNSQASSDALFRELIELCKHNRINLSFLIFPVNPNYKDREDLNTMITSLEKLGQRVLNLEKLTQESYSLAQRKDWFLNAHDPCHFSPAGMKEMATLIQSQLDFLLFHKAQSVLEQRVYPQITSDLARSPHRVNLLT